MGSTGIGTLNESSLHAALKELVAEPGDRFEQEVDGFVADIKRDDLLIEIQTGSFGAMGRKLDHLLGRYRIRVVHPVSVATYLHRPDRRPRRSPKKGNRYSVLEELVRIPSLLDHPDFSVEVHLVTTDAYQVVDPRMRRGRGGWRVIDRQLRSVEDTFLISGPDDLLRWLPTALPTPFTNADVADGSDLAVDQARRLTYCLRALERIDLIGHDRRGHLYRLVSAE